MSDKFNIIIKNGYCFINGALTKKDVGINGEKILKIGKEYPTPIVIHEKARQKALSAFKKI